MSGDNSSQFINHTTLNARLLFFFFNDTATTEIYTLSLHDALPISVSSQACTTARLIMMLVVRSASCSVCIASRDRKSTRLNSSHSQISYAVFCLKKKTTIETAIKHERDILPLRDPCRLIAQPVRHT